MEYQSTKCNREKNFENKEWRRSTVMDARAGQWHRSLTENSKRNKNGNSQWVH